MFVVFEGIDGAGKTTQVDLLQAWLEEHKLGTVKRFQQPGSTPLGQELRNILLKPDVPLNKTAEILLFTAARVMLIQEIKKALAAGDHVICDRWLLSALVYQTEGHDPVADTWIRGLHQRICEGLHPDVMFVLLLPAEVAFCRRDTTPGFIGECSPPGAMAAMKDRFEAQGAAVWRERATKYGILAPTLPNTEMLTATDPPAILAEKIRDILFARKLLPEALRGEPAATT